MDQDQDPDSGRSLDPDPHIGTMLQLGAEHLNSVSAPGGGCEGWDGHPSCQQGAHHLQGPGEQGAGQAQNAQVDGMRFRGGGDPDLCVRPGIRIPGSDLKVRQDP